MVRPSFILGGGGTGIAADDEEFIEVARHGLATSPVSEILVEESVEGWKEFELEVMRDRKDNAVIVCSIENLDPMGVHTGDSITVAPIQTLSDREYQEMRDDGIAVLRAIGVETGGSNVQFAVDPATGRRLVIEMNPRVSRSSALASKATGFPIAKIAALLAVGYHIGRDRQRHHGGHAGLLRAGAGLCRGQGAPLRLRQVPFGPEPARHVDAERRRGHGDWPNLPRGPAEGAAEPGERPCRPQCRCRGAHPARHGRRRVEPGDSHPDAESDLRRRRGVATRMGGRRGITAQHHRPVVRRPDRRDRRGSNRGRGGRTRESEPPGRGEAVWLLRSPARLSLGRDRSPKCGRPDARFGINRTYKTVDTCAAEFEAHTPYMYGTFEEESEVPPAERPRVVVLGSGPNRIGQGIEFDYCCVHASFALRDAGYETVMVNCNPETVSTDYDTSNRLYFEPLTVEDVLVRHRGRASGGRRRPARGPDPAQPGRALA